eukprot:scaffold117229_cov15-Tisochrysis_lutea.AAC.1
MQADSIVKAAPSLYCSNAVALLGRSTLLHRRQASTQGKARQGCCIPAERVPLIVAATAAAEKQQCMLRMPLGGFLISRLC